MASTCNKKGCDAKITFARSTATGRSMPLDLYPDTRQGTIRKHFITEHGEEASTAKCSAALHCTPPSRTPSSST